MKNRIILTLLALTLGLGTAFAQGKVTVKGTVLDKEGQSVIGAGVIERGTLNGTTTGIDGSYELTVSSGKAASLPLSVSRIWAYTVP